MLGHTSRHVKLRRPPPRRPAGFPLRIPCPSPRFQKAIASSRSHDGSYVTVATSAHLCNLFTWNRSTPRLSLGSSGSQTHFILLVGKKIKKPKTPGFESTQRAVCSACQHSTRTEPAEALTQHWWSSLVGQQLPLTAPPNLALSPSHTP